MSRGVIVDESRQLFSEIKGDNDSGDLYFTRVPGNFGGNLICMYNT